MTDSTPYPLLQTIDTPKDCRKLTPQELKQLAQELRQFMIESVSRTGGHLAAGLGTIELTIALHTVFNTPYDRLVWDVGHQSYPHKILSGRREQMASLRQRHGLAGFPKREESEYDTFGTGHSSTSISAALGMALAAKHRQEDRKVVAIIGDGAMGAGMAFEALNHAGDLDANLLVVLNDNEMSISPNVGGMSNYLSRLLSGQIYTSVRQNSKRVLSNLPPVLELAKRAEEHLKGMVVPGTLFEELGFNYIGPVDGHDLTNLRKTLTNMAQIDGPQLLHVVTQKGRGYPPAEDNPCSYHGLGPFDIETGQPISRSNRPTFTAIFSQWLVDSGHAEPDLVAITPAMREGSGLVAFSETFPKRYFDVGIAEQHAVTLAAGLACEGLKPVVAIYSTFLQRGYDQLIHDVALQKLPILFAIDRAGIVGPDGPTHIGSFDIAALRPIPNLIIMTPANEQECRQLLTTGLHYPHGPAAVRYPRGSGPNVAIDSALTSLPIGQAELIRHGERVAILVFGPFIDSAVAAAQHYDATVVNMRFVKPLDTALLQQLAATHPFWITIEDGVIQGGAGSAVMEWLQQQQLSNRLIPLGHPDEFLEQGSRDELLQQCQLDRAGICAAIDKLMVANH
ncbi:1-deoxy-D-xylulose-5-phosphate synthase [Ectothiorhodospiraceae bacterium BW-2]|nr:1-deoxy-D-xylulose-5-phosphate synthase [Ectothiorhodospiraceae bacterium BW-2]